MAARAQGRSDRRRKGLAHADAEVPAAAGAPATAMADPGGCPHISCDADSDLRARLLQGLRTHRSRHLLGVETIIQSRAAAFAGWLA